MPPLPMLLTAPASGRAGEATLLPEANLRNLASISTPLDRGVILGCKAGFSFRSGGVEGFEDPLRTFRRDRRDFKSSSLDIVS